MTDLIEKKFKGRYGSADNVMFPNSKYMLKFSEQCRSE